MGWETGVTSLVSAYSSFEKTNQAKATADATIKEGEYQASNIADNTKRTVGSLQTSFLQSGLTLDSADGASNVISQAFSKGQTDISRTLDNANNSAKNTMSAARTAALTNLGSSLTSMWGAKSGANTSSLTYGTDSWNGLGQEIGSALDPSPVGPYQSPLSSSYYE